MDLFMTNVHVIYSCPLTRILASEVSCGPALDPSSQNSIPLAGPVAVSYLHLRVMFTQHCVV